MTTHEEKNDCLQEVLDTYLSILLNEIKEGFLMIFPVFDNVAASISIEDGADEDPVAKLAGHATWFSNQVQLWKKLVVEVLLTLVFSEYSLKLADSTL